jgi:hypothetical protein
MNLYKIYDDYLIMNYSHFVVNRRFDTTQHIHLSVDWWVFCGSTIWQALKHLVRVGITEHHNSLSFKSTFELLRLQL